MDETKAGQEAGTPRTPMPPEVARGLRLIEELLSVDPRAMEEWLEAHPVEAERLARKLARHGLSEQPAPQAPPTTDGSVSMAGKEK